MDELIPLGEKMAWYNFYSTLFTSLPTHRQSVLLLPCEF